MECPICEFKLVATAETYTLDQLFDHWKPAVLLPKELIEDHRQQAEQTTLYQCPNCDLGIFNPQIIGTPELYRQLEVQMPSMYYLENKWDFDMGLEDVYGCKSIIEIGCGQGSFLAKAQQLVSCAVGTEYNPNALTKARERGLTVYGFQEQDILQAGRGRFDAVFTFQVLEHVEQPLEFVQECLKWVRAGGKIGIAVPNSDSIIRHYRQNYLNLPPHHATRWSAKTFAMLAKRLNLKVERIAYEPLYDYHYDFVKHWWLDHFSQTSTISSVVSRLGARGLHIILLLLKQLRIRRLPIRGHSIYVLMSKPLSEP